MLGGNMNRDEENPRCVDDERPDSEQKDDAEVVPESELEKQEKKKRAEIEENPDLEDPRLYSPLQEPDRPAPKERTRDEEDEPITEASESFSHDEEHNPTSSQGD